MIQSCCSHYFFPFSSLLLLLPLLFSITLYWSHLLCFSLRKTFPPSMTHIMLQNVRSAWFLLLSNHENCNMNTDCCKWDGVICNYFIGNTIDIDLSYGMLQGIIHPNTTLFHLPYLQRLNLTYNDLFSSQLTHNLTKFSSILTHLNISASGFTGEISS